MNVTPEDMKSITSKPGDFTRADSEEDVHASRKAHRMEYVMQFIKLRDELTEMWEREQRVKFAGRLSYSFADSFRARTGVGTPIKFSGGFYYPQIRVGFPIEELLAEHGSVITSKINVTSRALTKLWGVFPENHNKKYSIYHANHSDSPFVE